MIRRLLGFLVIACFGCALPAVADITYTITGPDFNLNFTLPPNPQHPYNPLNPGDSYGDWGFNLYPVDAVLNSSSGTFEISFYIDGMCVGSGLATDADPECGILSLWSNPLFSGN